MPKPKGRVTYYINNTEAGHINTKVVPINLAEFIVFRFARVHIKQCSNIYSPL